MQSAKERLIYAYYIINDSLVNSYKLLAFRAKRANGCKGRKLIKCPNPTCTRRLTDVDEDTKVKLITLTTKTDIKCQNYIRCIHCGTDVGLIYI